MVIAAQAIDALAAERSWLDGDRAPLVESADLVTQGDALQAHADEVQVGSTDSS